MDDDSAGDGQGGRSADGALAAVLLAGRDALGLRADQRVVLTLGPRGAAVLDGCDVLIQPAPAVAVVDSTGAGDAFVGAFAAGLVQDAAATGSALAAGVAAGALACGAVGARSATPDAAAIAVMRAGLPPQRLVQGQPSAR
ncbi:PfkB family carbohydrate kinase [Tistrella bauzanensis]